VSQALRVKYQCRCAAVLSFQWRSINFLKDQEIRDSERVDVHAMVRKTQDFLRLALVHNDHYSVKTN
jgi:hypothetical protein